jgi:hypothetical protein
MSLEKQRYEMPLEYLERVLSVVTQKLNLKGVALTCTSNKGKHFMVSHGEVPPIQLLEHIED